MQFVLIMFTATVHPLGSFIYRGVIAGPGEGAHMSLLILGVNVSIYPVFVC